MPNQQALSRFDEKFKEDSNFCCCSLEYCYPNNIREKRDNSKSFITKELDRARLEASIQETETFLYLVRHEIGNGDCECQDYLISTYNMSLKSLRAELEKPV